MTGVVGITAADAGVTDGIDFLWTYQAPNAPLDIVVEVHDMQGNLLASAPYTAGGVTVAAPPGSVIQWSVRSGP